MGVGISHVFASSAIPTVLVDATAELSETARARAVELLYRLEQAGNIGSGTAATAEQHLSAAPSIAAAVRGADLVVEAVVERPDVKLAVYAEIEPAAGDAVIATNTSSIPIAQLGTGLRNPSRFLGPLVRAPAARPVRRGHPHAVDRRRVVDLVVEALTRSARRRSSSGRAGIRRNRISS
jgi:3-hydroxyacyl-CoA dehydrogenase